MYVRNTYGSIARPRPWHTAQADNIEYHTVVHVHAPYSKLKPKPTSFGFV